MKSPEDEKRTGRGRGVQQFLEKNTFFSLYCFHLLYTNLAVSANNTKLHCKSHFQILMF